MWNDRTSVVMSGWLVWVVVTATATAADEYVVPATSATVTAEFPGFVEADRGRLLTITPQAEKLVVTWCGENGRAVVPGDRIAVFDPAVILRDLPQKQADALGAVAQYRLELLRLDQTQAALEAEQAQARAQLLTVRAQLASLGDDAVGAVALARARSDQAAATTAAAVRAVARLRVQAQAGDATAQAVAAADQAVVIAQLEQQRAEAAWHTAADRDRSIDRERLLLQEQTLMGKLGSQRAADGVERTDPTLGYPGRLAENAKRRTAQEAALAAERDARTKAAHVAERDSHDHTPLAWIAIRPQGTPPTTATHWDFIAAGATLPVLPDAPGARQRDSGESFSDTRGWGWDRDLRDRLRSGADHAWLLIREPATWRCVLPNGRYTVAIGTGADSDWDGCLVRASGGGPLQVVTVANRIDGASWPVAETSVDVTDGRLTVLVGDDVPKSLHATTSGILLLQQQTSRGRKIQWIQRPVAFIAEPSALQINGRVPQELASLLTAASETPSATAEDPRAATAVHTVTVTPPGLPAGDPPLVGTITTVGSKPVGTAINEQGWNDQDVANPQDLGAREVTVALSAADAMRLRVRSAVRVRLSSVPPAGIWALPPWLVVSRDSRSWVQVRGVGYREVPAQRAGSQVLVRGLVAGMRLVVPDGPPPSEAAPTAQRAGYAGEVVTGVRTRVTMGGSWGRVESCIADGTEVTAGQEILTMYNPWIEQQQDNLKRERQNANRAFQEAAAARRERLLAAGEQRRDDLVAEANARLDLAQARKSDDQVPVNVVALALADAQRTYAASLLRATAELQAPGVAVLDDARIAARRAELADVRASLERARSVRAADWLDAATDSVAWHETILVLGDRERKADLARAEDRAAVMKARAALDQMLQNQEWVTDFELHRRLQAPVAGRLYWLNAWNDQTRVMGKVTKDVILWAGVPVAEVVDLTHLAFTAEVPEPRYPSLKSGQAASVVFPSLGDLRLTAAITRIGQALGPPRDARNAGADAPVADQRVFSVTVDLIIPSEQRGRLVPGVRGFLELP